MIIVQLMGGHSNQMFEYAAARKLALKHNTELYLDLEWFKHMEGVKSPRDYELGGYNLAGKIYTGSLLQRLKKKLAHVQYYEDSQVYDPSVGALGPNIYLHGYFQSEKYFKDIRSTLLQDFSYKAPPNRANSELLRKINEDPVATSLHIRRGDYAKDAETNARHGVAGLEYYREALKHLKKQVKDPTLYIISNDPAWCRENLKLDAKMIFVDNNDDTAGGAEDMRLMRACKHNIMANSSFSWWGAWLNENPDKIVIAPKKWFNDASINTSDLLPDEWVSL